MEIIDRPSSIPLFTSWLKSEDGPLEKSDLVIFGRKSDKETGFALWQE
ncbi:MAG: hypothetical protein HGA26_05685 [Chlorobiaceae bacterium]|nr:hypothetical protein [Chlorobiaceae bacterium]